VGFGDPARDGKTQAGAEPSARGIELDEAVEDPPLIGGRNARAVVADADAHRVGVLAHLDGDGAALRRMLDGVLQDVQNQPTEQILVAAK